MVEQRGREGYCGEPLHDVIPTIASRGPKRNDNSARSLSAGGSARRRSHASPRRRRTPGTSWLRGAGDPHAVLGTKLDKAPAPILPAETQLHLARPDQPQQWLPRSHSRGVPFSSRITSVVPRFHGTIRDVKTGLRCRFSSRQRPLAPVTKRKIAGPGKPAGGVE
jgi:hypothetical protein